MVNRRLWFRGKPGAFPPNVPRPRPLVSDAGGVVAWDRRCRRSLDTFARK